MPPKQLIAMMVLAAEPLLVDQAHESLVNAELLQVVIGDLYLGIHQRGTDTIDVIFFFHKFGIEEINGPAIMPRWHQE